MHGWVTSETWIPRTMLDWFVLSSNKKCVITLMVLYIRIEGLNGMEWDGMYVLGFVVART